MQASDIMSTPVISVAPDTPVREIAALLHEKRISAVPVLEKNRLVGLVSEGDLLHREEIGTDRAKRAGSWWLRLFSAEQTPAEYVKAHGRFARDVMTREVQMVAPDTSVTEIAILVQALAGAHAPAQRLTPPADQAIRGRLQAELARQPWWRAAASNVIVTHGVVHYFGTIEVDDEHDAARVAAENIPGVRAVEDHRMAMSRIAQWD